MEVNHADRAPEWNRRPPKITTEKMPGDLVLRYGQTFVVDGDGREQLREVRRG